MIRSLSQLVQTHTVSKERVAKLIAAYILYKQTGCLLEMLKEEALKHREIDSEPVFDLDEQLNVNNVAEVSVGEHDRLTDESINLLNDLNNSLYDEYDKLVDEFELTEELAYSFGQFLSSSIKDNSYLYINAHDIERTISATLILRSIHSMYSLGYHLPITIIANETEKRKLIVDKYLNEIKEIKEIVDERIHELEESEVEFVKDLDKRMMKLLINKGELFD